MKTRFLIAALLSLAFAAPAFAHPHVWVTMRSAVVYAPDGTVTGIRHAWSFDDMFSAFATQGYESKVKGEFTREELAPLAKVNVESLKEYDYFTYATVDGDKVRMADPLPDYYLSFENQVLTLHFTIPFEKPVKAKKLSVDIYDTTIFVSFEFAKKDAVALSGAPAGCKLDTVLPREMTYAEGKKLSEIPADQPNVSMAFGAQFSNKILVHCP
ncbi:MAG: DUF1007 family protein [Pseudolabrys sp.]|nr:DUF1007 family protein [Pseudolabrys sp.]MDP2294943.1 DUF1007 family protein [Pseudolabrys sp.]